MSDAHEKTPGRAEARPSLAERRRRQVVLLRQAEKPPNGQTAQDLAETFDAFERVGGDEDPGR